jgi:hypothetical protein
VLALYDSCEVLVFALSSKKEEEAGMSSAVLVNVDCTSKKIAEKTTRSSKKEKGRLRTMEYTNIEKTSNLMDYLPRERRC